MKLEDELTLSEQINMFLNLIDEQKTEIQKREVIVDSLTESLVKKVKHIGSYIFYTEGMLDDAWRNKNGENYKFINKDLKKRVFAGRTAKLDSISPLNYDRCVYNFYYICNGIKFCLEIPNTKVANAKNIYYMSYGKFNMTYESKPGFYEFVAKSYDLEDISKAVNDFFENRKIYQKK